MPERKRDGSMPQASHAVFPVCIDKTYTAVICGNGRILPIVESIGRRVLREIDPASSEGREILRSGRASLWSEDGTRLGRIPVERALRDLEARVRQQRAEHAEVPRWRRHHSKIAASVARSRKDLSG